MLCGLEMVMALRLFCVLWLMGTKRMKQYIETTKDKDTNICNESKDIHVKPKFFTKDYYEVVIWPVNSMMVMLVCRPCLGKW